SPGLTSQSIQIALSHVAFAALRTALSLPLAFWVHSLCCDIQTQTLKKSVVLSTQEMRFSTSSTVLNGQPGTHGLPPLFFALVSLGFLLLALTCTLIQSGASAPPGQTNTLSRNFRASNVGARRGAALEFVTVAVISAPPLAAVTSTKFEPHVTSASRPVVTVR